MIRTAYPHRTLQQAQLRLELAARRTRHALQARRKNLSSEAPLPASPTPAENTRPIEAVVSATPSAPTTDASHRSAAASFDVFYDKYDALTALICLAAQEGVSPKRESRYQEARAWFLHAYPHDIPGIEAWENYGNDKNTDAPLFARFWTPPTLLNLLQGDSGDLIAQMEKSYEVLIVWEKSLTQPAPCKD